METGGQVTGLAWTSVHGRRPPPEDGARGLPLRHSADSTEQILDFPAAGCRRHPGGMRHLRAQVQAAGHQAASGGQSQELGGPCGWTPAAPSQRAGRASCWDSSPDKCWQKTSTQTRTQDDQRARTWARVWTELPEFFTHTPHRALPGKGPRNCGSGITVARHTWSGLREAKQGRVWVTMSVGQAPPSTGCQTELLCSSGE